MDRIVVLDFEYSNAHVYLVPEGSIIDDEYIEQLGHNTSNCYWMYTNEIIYHE